MSDPRTPHSRAPLSPQALEAWKLYLQKRYADVRSYVGEVAQDADNDFGLHFVDGLAASRLGDPAIGLKAMKQGIRMLPEIENFHAMEAVNRQRGIVAVVDHMEAKFIQYCQITSAENIIISYPKCGRTWIRIVLGKYVLGNAKGNPIDISALTEQSSVFPTTRITHDDYPHLIRSGEISDDKRMYEGKRVAFLVRDPRDVMVSNYFQFIKRKDHELINQNVSDVSLSDFIRQDIGGMPSLVNFYNVWAENSAVPADFKIYYYEDFHGAPHDTYRDLMEFLSFPDLGQTAFEESVDFGCFDNMQKAEDADSFNDARLRTPDLADPESRKVRKGKIGGYVDYMTAGDIEYCEQMMDESLHPIYDRYLDR